MFGYQYKANQIHAAIESGKEFILQHQLYLSDKTGKIIHADFLKLRYPYRWKYDILRALDYFQFAGFEWDNRMEMSIGQIMDKKNKTNTWNVPAKHPGQVHFDMEKAGKPSRWNTLRVMRVLKHFHI